MSEFKHTPAPWRVIPKGKSIGNGSMIFSGEKKVASVTAIADKPLSQKIADAMLIAAAPELLEALEMMLEMSEMKGFGKSAAEDTARAAIKKAKGES